LKKPASLWGHDHATNLNGMYDESKETMIEEMHNYIYMGSGWRLDRVVKLVIHTTEYAPLNGNSYVELPEFIKAKKAVINIKNTDTQCFKWCVTRVLNPIKVHAERVDKSLRMQAQQLRWDGIEFPVKLSDIDKFEKLNNNIAINVFFVDGKYIEPLRISGAPVNQFINLLLYNEHYCLISNFGRLVRSQITSHKCASIFCYRCLSAFSYESALVKHEYYCRHHTPRRVTIPNVTVKFKNYNR
jgi:hypothetical protein